MINIREELEKSQAAGNLTDPAAEAARFIAWSAISKAEPDQTRREDILGFFFLKFVKSWQRIQPTRAAGYIKTMARNAARDYHRQDATYNSRADRYGSKYSETETTDTHRELLSVITKHKGIFLAKPKNETGTLRDIIGIVDCRWLDKNVRATLRQIAREYHKAGLTCYEIAKAMGFRPGTIWRWIQK